VLAPDPYWPVANGPISLAPGEVHVWRIALAPTPEELTALYERLAANERERADRFVVAAARTQFVAARAALRALIAGYLRRSPADISFQIGPLGKPSVAAGEPFFFNLSHSREMALVAVTGEGEIGVDVEQVREMSSREQLAERFFHPNEVATLGQLPVTQRAIGFFNAWTRKEAFLKATGKGISFGIERVEVTLTPGDSPRVLTVDGSREAAARWSLASLDPAPGYVGSVALDGRWKNVAGFTYRHHRA
jgi:4'-phosphopantetheinyl transferase